MSELKLNVFNNFNDCEVILSKISHEIENPFLKINYLKLWWNNFCNHKQLHLIIILDGDNIVGFAPFYYEYSRLLRLYKFSIIGSGFSSYLDIYFTDGYGNDIIAALFEHFKNDFSNSIVNFDDINDKFSNLFLPISNKLKKNGTISSAFRLYPCPLVVLPENWEAFYKTRGDHRSRYNLRKRLERLSAVFGEVNFREIDNKNEIPSLMKTIEQIHKERFAHTYNDLFNKNNRNFIFDFLTNMVGNDASLSLIALNNIPLSFLIGFRMGETFIDFAPGFDPAFASLGLGNIHLMKLIELKINQGYKYFDFSKGEAEYKRWWADSESNSHFFRFGFRLNYLGILYFKYKDLISRILLMLRSKNYNSKIKADIARIKNIFTFKNKNYNIRVIEGGSQLQFNGNYNLEKWSYDKIQNFPVKVREFIIRYVVQKKLSNLSIATDIKKKLIILNSGNEKKRYFVHY